MASGCGGRHGVNGKKKQSSPRDVPHHPESDGSREVHLSKSTITVAFSVHPCLIVPAATLLIEPQYLHHQ